MGQDSPASKDAFPAMNTWQDIIGAMKERKDHALRALGRPTDMSDRRIMRLKDKHKGQRLFIVGNGPSMRREYFELLEGRLTIGFNHIHRVFPSCAWRPSYLMVHDPIIGEEVAREMRPDRRMRVLAGRALYPFFDGWAPHGTVLYYRIPFVTPSGTRPRFRTNLVAGMQNGGTVVYAALQMAWYMGIREVYLLGVDVNYEIEERSFVRNIGHSRVVRGDFKGSYFDPALGPGDSPRVAPDVESMMLALESAREFFTRRGGRIYNAAPDSPIKLFPFRPIHEVLAPGGQ